MIKDFWRESFSYGGINRLLKKVQREHTPERVSYGDDKDQYFLYYEPHIRKSGKIIFWVHGGGWNAGDPDFFDYVGQHVAKEGYRFISAGYRLSPKNKYPAQIEDVCTCYNKAMKYLRSKDIDISQVVVAGPSAGAHLSSILCFSNYDQEKYNVDISNIIGYVGWGGPYSFRKDQGVCLKLLERMLFSKGYDRKQAEPVSLMSHNHIPMLLIQSPHDGLVEYACAEDLNEAAGKAGNACELYSVTDEKDTHSWYTAGVFLLTREENKGLDKFFSWIESL